MKNIILTFIHQNENSSPYNSIIICYYFVIIIYYYINLNNNYDSVCHILNVKNYLLKFEKLKNIKKKKRTFILYVITINIKIKSSYIYI